MRSKTERLDLTEKKVAKRLRQLLNSDRALRKIDGEPWVRWNWLKDRSIIGRCGHRRCMCHWIEKGRYQEKKYEVIDEVA